MSKPVSRRGVYHDLTISPYVYKTPYGDILKFPSQKKIDVYTRQVDKTLGQIWGQFIRIGIMTWLDQPTRHDIESCVYLLVYEQQKAKWK